MANYQVKLPIFEGPFDLLFHLIEEQKIDIYDIPIASITFQYLEYLHMLETLDMDVASSFLIMAATLLEIKSKLLLPQNEEIPGPEETFENEEGIPSEDVRQDLVNKLLEYRKYKMIALKLRELERNSSRIYSRAIDYFPQPAEILQIQIGPNDLLNFFQNLIRRRLNPPVHKVVLEKLNLHERIELIRQLMFSKPGTINFLELVPSRENRYETILSFMAILEMAKIGELEISQTDNFRPIFVKKVDSRERNLAVAVNQ